MITGKIDNKTVWATCKTWERAAGWHCREIGAWPVQVCGSAQVNGLWVYFAWVSAERGRAELVDFDAVDLHWTEAAAVRADAQEKIKELMDFAGLVTRVVLSTHQSGFFMRVCRAAVAVFTFPEKNTGRATKNLLRQQRPENQGAGFPSRSLGGFYD